MLGIRARYNGSGLAWTGEHGCTRLVLSPERRSPGYGEPGAVLDLWQRQTARACGTRRTIRLSRLVLLAYSAGMTIFITMVRRVRHRAVTTSVGLAPAC